MKTYKLIILISSLFLSSAFVARGEEVNIIAQADSAYSAEKYSEAVALYSKAIKKYGTSSDLYYNLGDAYYRNGNLGKAMVCFKRSLRLDPTNDDAKQNVQFLKTKLIDRVGDSGSFFGNSFDAISNIASSNMWAWISFGLFVLVVTGVILYLFSNIVLVRKFGFFGGILCIVLMLVSISFSVHAHSLSVAKDEAVIIAPSTILSTSPRQPKDRNEEAMLLHEGTIVKILDSVTSGTGDNAVKWCEVQVDNAHRAWIKSTDIEII